MRGPADPNLWTAAMAAAADRYTIDELGMPSPVLMERAALCVSAEVERLADARGIADVVVLVGPGNNGGDGLAVARQLHGRGWRTCAVTVTDRHNDAVGRQLALARSHGVEVTRALPEPPREPTIVVDAMLGTGSSGAPRGGVAEALRWLGSIDPDRAPVVAVDLPSGVDVDRGAVLDLVASAALTVTFGRSKIGLHLTPAREHVGELVVADIGLIAAPDADESPARLIAPTWVADRLASLPDAIHKGRRGHVGVIGGTGGTPGAAILAASAALRAGAGLATLAPIDSELRGMLIEKRPELMLAPAEAAWSIPAANVLVVGPGLVEADAAALARLRSEDPRPMVWDASGLDHWALGSTAGPRVITPHPGEAARLLERFDPDGDWDSAKVQADRRAAAERLAELTEVTVVLKGAGTIVAGPDLAICVTGGPALATAGTGDVLAGLIGSLLARGLDAWDAACVGVHVHGLAGDRAPADGAVAMDIADGLVAALAEARAGAPLPRWPTLIRG